MKKSKYINLNRIEFIITDNCTSHCDHCSIPLEQNRKVINVESAIEALELSVSQFAIESIMTFGGEPLLYPEIVCQIHSKAYVLNIPSRQIITNAYWTKNRDITEKIAIMLKKSHINDILVSIDAFHQKYLSFEHVKFTIKKLIDLKFESLKINPCWFDSPEGENEYDEITRSLLSELSKIGVETSQGNIMYPQSNAVINFPKKFKRKINFNGMKCSENTAANSK